MDIGDVAWRVVSFDLDNSTAEIEATVQPQRKIKLLGQDARYWEDLSAGEKAQVESGSIVVDRNMLVEPNAAEAQARRTAILNATRQSLEGNTIEELFALSGMPKLRVTDQAAIEP